VGRDEEQQQVDHRAESNRAAGERETALGDSQEEERERARGGRGAAGERGSGRKGGLYGAPTLMGFVEYISTQAPLGRPMRPPKRPEPAASPAEAQVGLKVRTADWNRSYFAAPLYPPVQIPMSLRESIIPCQRATLSPIPLGLPRARTQPCTHSHGVTHTVLPQVRASHLIPDQWDRLFFDRSRLFGALCFARPGSQRKSAAAAR
jgi:hypothetical protein